MTTFARVYSSYIESYESSLEISEWGSLKMPSDKTKNMRENVSCIHTFSCH